MMKILYLDFNLPHLLKDADFPVGGATVEWYAWIQGFKENNQQITVLTWKGAKKYIGKTPEFDLLESFNPQVGIPKLKVFVEIYPALLKAVKQEKPDYLVQACAGVETGIMAYIGKKLNIPFIYRVENNMDTDQRLKKRLSKYQQFIYQYGLKYSHAIICQNHYQCENLKKRFPNKKITVIHAPYNYQKKQLKIRNYSERKYIGWLAIFQHQKNLPALLDTVKIMQDIEFRIAGKVSSNFDSETKSALNVLEQCKNVKFVGYLNRSKVMSFLSEAYALLNTSHYEGFPSTFLESFAAGTPVVTTHKIDPDQIIAINKLGRVGENYSDIPDLLTSLMEDKNYNDIAQRCRDYVIENHNPKILAQQFIESIK